VKLWRFLIFYPFLTLDGLLRIATLSQASLQAVSELPKVPSVDMDRLFPPLPFHG
jgi:hypothetical protein